MSDKAKSVGQDEEKETPKEPKEPKERGTPKMVEGEPGPPPRPPHVERPRPETDRDSFRPPPALKRDDRDKSKDDKKKRGKNGV